MNRWFIIVVALVVGLTGNAIGKTIHVKVGGTGDGSSWVAAYGDLQTAIDDADPNDEIWVAEGKYVPTKEVGGIGDRYKTFQMKNYVGIYGGFSATGEPGWEERDWEEYETVLSGDLLGNDLEVGDPCDLPDEPSRLDNCYHVFYHPDGTNLDDTAVLNGFTIIGGNASGDGSGCCPYNHTYNQGGGMYNYECGPTVTNCIFTGNIGSGMHNTRARGSTTNSSSSVTKYCVFSGNTQNGMVNTNNNNATVINCTFIGNSGNGMNNYRGSQIVTNCTFNRNNGCGMVNSDNNSTVTNCIFTGNSASYYGGGMLNNGTTTVVNCTFNGNSAIGRGGGIYNHQGSISTITNCIIWGNTANDGNEIARNNGSIVTISYCDIHACITGGLWDASLGTDGGGNIDVDPLFVDAIGGDVHLQGISPCINAGDNTASSLPATDFEGDPRIIYGIVDMGADEVANDVMLSLDVTIHPFSRIGTVTFDPAGGMYPPGTTVSITVEAEEGYMFDNWSEDLVGNDNPTTITMDSHKYVTAHFVFSDDIIYVNGVANGLNNGRSWANAFTDLQDALAVSVGSQEIWVAAGTYYPSSDHGSEIGDRGKHFRMTNGVGIYGGFPSTGDPIWVDRDPNTNKTILSGDLLDNDDPCTPPEDLLDDPSRGDNCYHVFYHPAGTNLDPNSVLDGFTVTGGNADRPGLYPHTRGGGMANYESSPTVTNCTFLCNSARVGGGMLNDGGTINNCSFIGNRAYTGGGICNSSNNATIDRCTFIDNSAEDGGGGISNSGYSKIIFCTFKENSAGFGGGMANTGGTINNCSFIGNRAYSGGGINNKGWASVTNCTFQSNTASLGGGMLCSKYNRTLVLTNCIFSGNSASNGGGIYNVDSSPSLFGCTFSGNVADGYGGGLFNTWYYFGGNPTVQCCILWGNTAGRYGPQIYNAGIYPTVTYSLIQGGWEGTGNIDADPCFADPGYWGNKEDPNIIVEPNDPNAVWINGDYHLLEGSTCIDSGDPNYVAGPNKTDLDGNPRIIGGRIDMGAYEYNPPIPAEVRIVPQTINLNSKGKWIAAILKLPEDCNVADIDPDNVFLENIKSLRFWLTEDQQVAIAMFDRSEVQAILNTGNIELTITGWLIDGTRFEGKDTIKIIDNSDKNKGRK